MNENMKHFVNLVVSVLHLPLQRKLIYQFRKRNGLL